MAVTLKEISKWLDINDVKYKLNEDVIYFGAGDGEENNQSVFIRAKEDGELFELKMQLLNMEDMDNVDIKDHKHLGKLLQHLLYLNYKTKFGTWEYDPSDGDIRLAIEIPLEDALMTQKQFDRILNYAMKDGGEHAQEIRTIMQTGEIPESDDMDDMMMQLLRSYIAQKEAAEKSKKEEDDEDGI